jgi:hypothetical protein
MVINFDAYSRYPFRLTGFEKISVMKLIKHPEAGNEEILLSAGGFPCI